MLIPPSKPRYAAHTPNQAGEWHVLKDHLINTARRCESFLPFPTTRVIAYRAGLLHDLGKSPFSFQDYLWELWQAEQEGCTPPAQGPPHAVPGAVLARDVSHPLCFAIAGHHAGLHDMPQLLKRLHDVEQDLKPEELKRLAIEELGLSPDSFKPLSLSWPQGKRRLEFSIRMLFSALVDADWLDTEEHFHPQLAKMRAQSIDLSTLARLLEAHIEQLSEKGIAARSERERRLAAVRQEVYEAGLTAAGSRPGAFRLTVPTGGGKTLSGMAFALKHAVHNGLERVIVAIPYTSIIEQTASVYREVFGDDVVLEHHSGVYFDDEHETGVRLKLAGENWDMPVVVTTTVQLFESMFSCKPSKCRKLHNLARSVIVLDEVQTLPVELLDPIVDGLKALIEDYGTSVVFCTATQPVLSGDGGPATAFPPESVTEIVPQYPRHFQLLKRVDYQVLDDPLDWDELASMIAAREQVLVVLNSRVDALNLLDALTSGDTPSDESGLYHLSTLLCGAHRRSVLAEVKDRLGNGLPCRLISTQVVEAGVDLDFPVVMRAIGPLDRIVQAAGRCNREGERESGEVIVFTPADEHKPRGPYAAGIDEARILLGESVDLHDPSTFERYFRNLYMDCETDKCKVQKSREEYRFRETAARFRMIREDTVPVVVPYGNYETALTTVLRSPSQCSAWRELQPYIVSLYEMQYRIACDQGLIGTIDERIPVGLWSGVYDSLRGVAQMRRDPADLIA